MTAAISSSPSTSAAAVAIDRLEAEIRDHVALKELREFGNLLVSRPLDPDGVKTFFATMRAFFDDIPTGILSLALRISDDWMKVDPYEATAKGAYILFADVDEFGLHEQHKGFLPTHHQLFRDLTAHLGVSKADLDAPQYVLKAGVDLGDATTEYYRRAPVAEGLGFHLASETTSQREFVYFLKGFQKHQAHYGLTGDDDPVLDFFRVHTIVEPMHRARGREILEIYHAQDPNVFEGARRGAIAFMDGFAELFAALNEKLFGTSIRRQMTVAQA
jgi:hypothetical protein